MTRIPLAQVAARAVTERLEVGWSGAEYGCEIGGKACLVRGGCGGVDGDGSGEGEGYSPEEL